jgi:hypothetical protein
MRNKRLLRYGLLSAALFGGALGTLLVACGDDDDVTPNPKIDGGGTDSPITPGNDTGTGQDTGTPGEGGPPDAGTPAKIYFVHAGTAFGPDSDETGAYAGGVRVCFSTATVPTPADKDFTPTPFPAAPTDAGAGQPYPGLFIGTGGPFSTSGADLETITVRPYLMNAKSLNTRGYVGQDPTVPRCGKLLSDGGVGDGGPGGAPDLEINKDYWQLADIPAGTLKKGNTYILAVTGCAQNANATAGFCGKDNAGATFVPNTTPGPGNLKILILELDPNAVAADEFGAQAINLSPQQDAFKAAVGPWNPTLVNAAYLDGGDEAGDAAAANTFSLSGGEVPYDRNAQKPTPVAVAKIKGLLTASGYFALGPAAIPGNGVRGPAKLNNVGAAVPQTTVQFASTGSTDATELYVNGKTYTFILVGDPQLSPATTGSRAMHYIGFPNKQ